jgi:hypothetical protein
LVDQLERGHRSERSVTKPKFFVRFIVAMTALLAAEFAASKLEPTFFDGLAKFDDQLLASISNFNPVQIYSYFNQSVSDVRELNQETRDKTAPPDSKPDREPEWSTDTLGQNVAELRGGVISVVRQVASRGWLGLVAMGLVAVLTCVLCLLIVFARKRTPKRLAAAPVAERSQR